jgi:glycosyltransferase involved in cell wall biosynthesis
MKVYVHPPNESWICDRFASEWNTWIQNSDNNLSVSKSFKESDLIWLLADWCWRKVDPYSLSRKKVIATVHHIVPNKFGNHARMDFMQRDEFVDAYHVPCMATKIQIQDLTTKPIYSFPFWVNQNIWFEKDKNSLRKRYNINQDVFLIGSFQRDTEGFDLKSPKLEKGPDVFCNIVSNIYKENKNIKVLLAGWRRQYVMERLKQERIPFLYQELPSFEVLNDFYNMLDLYIVASRYEGGPQAIFESSITKTPIISTSVGYAEELLHKKSLISNGADWRSCQEEDVIKYNFDQVSKIRMPEGFNNFINMINEVAK